LATSGSYDFSTSATNLIGDALYKIGAKQEGEDVPAEQFTPALRQLNRLIKFIASKEGRHLWRRDEMIVFLAPSQPRYLLGPSASTDDEWCFEEDFVATKLNGAVAASGTTLTVDSSTDMAADDILGLELTDGTRSWTTISSVDSSTSLTVPAIAGAASDNASVYTYTTRPQRPLRILHCRRKEGTSGEDIEVDIESQELYRDQPLKTTNGTPVFVTYKPTLTSGRLEVWQPPSSVQMYLGVTVERPFEDFDAGANEPDVPQEWYDPLVYMLADRLEPEYRILDPLRVQLLKAEADKMWEWVNDFDDDTGSIYLMPEYEGAAGYGP